MEYHQGTNLDYLILGDLLRSARNKYKRNRCLKLKSHWGRPCQQRTFLTKEPLFKRYGIRAKNQKIEA